MHPESIEQKLDPIIQKPFFVAGLPDDKFGEQLVLIIESNEVEVEFDAVKEALETYEVPKQIIPVPEFARTPTGKIQRKETLQKI